nr:capsular biosynthesis protein [Burkholderia sp. BCC0322]
MIDQDVEGSGAVASYLAGRIMASGHRVRIISLSEARNARAAERSILSNESVISLTASYRSSTSEKIVYWLDESSMGTAKEVPNVFVRFKHLFAGAMNVGSLRGERVFVNDIVAKRDLSTRVERLDVLPFPLTQKIGELPGEYGRTIVAEVGDVDMTDDDLIVCLDALDQPGIENLLVFSANHRVREHLIGISARVASKPKIIQEFDIFEAELSRGLLYAGIGLDARLSFRRLSLAAALLRPVVLYRSSIDERYFVNEVTGFETDDLDHFGQIAEMFASGVLPPEAFGESLHLYQMRRYSPDQILMDALQ